MSTAEAPELKNHPPPAAFNCGPSSCTFMPGGTPHEGWKMTSSMSAREDRRRRAGLAHHDLLGQHRLAVLEDGGHLLRHAVPDVEGAEVRRHPAPALQVDDQPLDILGRLGGGGRCVLGLGGARSQQRLAQALELRMPGVEVAQIGVDRIGGGNRQHQRLGIVDGRLLVEDAVDRQRVHASAARMPAILQDGEAELDLGFRQRLGGRRCLRQRRQIEGRRLQAPVIGFADLAHRLRGPGREAILAGPDRLAGMLGIERHKSRMVVPIAGVAGLRALPRPVAGAPARRWDRSR